MTEANRRAPVEVLDHPWRAIVSADCRGLSSPDEHSMLRQPENLEEWRRALRELKRDIETQFQERDAVVEGYRADCMTSGEASREADFRDYNARHLNWRGKAARFVTLVDNKLDECELLLRRHAEAAAAGAVERMFAITREVYRRGEFTEAAFEELKAIAEGVIEHQESSA